MMKDSEIHISLLCVRYGYQATPAETASFYQKVNAVFSKLHSIIL